jgi:large subunit ribosomal protein L17
MATQGRKNVHGKGGVRFKAPYTTSKRKSELRNIVSTLIVKEHISVTSGMVDDLQKLFDRLIGYAKVNDVHSRRLALRIVRPFVVDEKEKILAIDKLFNELGPRYKDRQGGYTRALRKGPRRGDNAMVYLVSLVK